jgi:hypothetical protein
MFGDADGRIPATFEVLYVVGWSPHESQHQALKPGSGKVSLEAALGGSGGASGVGREPGSDNAE